MQHAVCHCLIRAMLYNVAEHVLLAVLSRCHNFKCMVVDLSLYIGCAMSGLIADSRTMVDKARVEAQVGV